MIVRLENEVECLRGIYGGVWVCECQQTHKQAPQNVVNELLVRKRQEQFEHMI